MPYLLVALVIGVGGWIASSAILGATDGWRRLAKRYGGRLETADRREADGTGTVGGERHNHALNVAAGPDGIELSATSFYSRPPPPLAIPWSAMTGVESSGTPGPSRRFSFQVDGVDIALTGAAAHVAHGAWQRATQSARSM